MFSEVPDQYAYHKLVGVHGMSQPEHHISTMNIYMQQEFENSVVAVNRALDMALAAGLGQRLL